MRHVLPLFLALCSCTTDAAEPAPKSQAPKGFWDTWGDGRAELAGYRLVQPRYGEQRRGEAVLIFVTEDFTDATRVKSDGGHGDEYPVIKLNETRDFQTGVYDYNVMTSAFVRLDGRDALGVPTKVAFGAQEWCGHVYDHVITHGDRYDRTTHSYFDGEADQQTKMEIPKRAVFLDAMPLFARGFAGDLVAPGGAVEVQLHPRLIDLRFQHRGAEWMPGRITREVVATPVEVPAGSFAVERLTVTSGDRVWAYDIEQAAPHRLIRWSGPDGETGELTGSIRTDYWSKHDEGDESLRRDLGLGDPSWLRGD
ncbi:MAG: hypothetical protein H6737_25550 [Alphaproteobacteria bacterium]|nr:hypothetical protein [Alphaproteobacteria bacterium]